AGSSFDYCRFFFIVGQSPSGQVVEHRRHPTVVIDVAYEEDLGGLLYARFRQGFLDE
ncbi:hypothetical protein A2U01_0084921, partial [Trifolium medium]|nr:hypothetical protein [Trifolium medium]